MLGVTGRDLDAGHTMHHVNPVVNRVPTVQGLHLMVPSGLALSPDIADCPLLQCLKPCTQGPLRLPVFLCSSLLPPQPDCPAQLALACMCTVLGSTELQASNLSE